MLVALTSQISSALCRFLFPSFDDGVFFSRLSRLIEMENYGLDIAKGIVKYYVDMGQLFSSECYCHCFGFAFVCIIFFDFLSIFWNLF